MPTMPDMYGAVNLRLWVGLGVRQIGAQVLLVGPAGVVDRVPASPRLMSRDAMNSEGTTGSAPMSLLTAQRLLVLGEPFLVVVEVLPWSTVRPVAVWNAATKPSAMYSGQLETRSLPDAGLPSSSGALGASDDRPDALLSELQAAGTTARDDGGRCGSATADEPTPRLSWASTRGSMSAMAGFAFRYGESVREFVLGEAGESSSISSRSCGVGMSASAAPAMPPATTRRTPGHRDAASAGSVSGPTWAITGDPSAAASDKAQHRSLEGQVRDGDRHRGRFRTGASIETRTRSGRTIRVALPPGSIVVSPGRARRVEASTSIST